MRWSFHKQSKQDGEFKVLQWSMIQIMCAILPSLTCSTWSSLRGSVETWSDQGESLVVIQEEEQISYEAKWGMMKQAPRRLLEWGDWVTAEASSWGFRTWWVLLRRSSQDSVCIYQGRSEGPSTWSQQVGCEKGGATRSVRRWDTRCDGDEQGEWWTNLAASHEAMIQVILWIPYIVGKAQRITGQSPGLEGSTLFPLQGFVPLGFPCKVFNEGVLQGSKLNSGS